MTQLLSKWIVCALLLMCSNLLLAAEPVEIDANLTSKQLGTHIDFLEDAGGNKFLDDVVTSKQWQTGKTPVLNFGFSSSYYWLRLNIHTQDLNSPYLLQVEYALLDAVELFVLKDKQLIQHYRVGNAVEVAARPIKHRTFLFPLQLAAQQNYQVYLRVNGNVSVQLPIILWRAQEFWENDQRHMILQGIYFGVLSVMMVYNLFFYFSLREKIHLIYVLMVSAIMMFMFSFRGIGFAYLWPHQLWWNERVISFVIPMANGSFVLFANTFLHSAEHAPKMHRYQMGFMGFSFLLAFISLLLPKNILVPIETGLVLTSFVGITILSCMLLRSDRAARFFAVAYLLFIFGGIVLALSKFGILEYSFTSENSLQFGSALESFLLSIALSERIKTLQQEKLHALEAEMLAKDESFYVQQRELRGQMENQAKSEFLASMSHEIRTPMNGVLGLAELLKATPLNEQQRDYLNTLSNSGQALLTVINDILDYSKVNAGKILLDEHEFVLDDIIDDTLALFTPQIKASAVKLFSVVASGTPQNWLGDSHRIRQILINLIGNAFKFTEQGFVKLVVKLERKSNGEFLRFEVIDSGIGLNSEQAARLFRSYSQADSSVSRKYGGTGLGLAISKRLVELMDGEIGVQSELGRGSSFWFTLALTPIADRNGFDVAIDSPLFSAESQHLILCRDLTFTRALKQNLTVLGGSIQVIDAVEKLDNVKSNLLSPIKSVFICWEEALPIESQAKLIAFNPEKVVLIDDIPSNFILFKEFIQLSFPVSSRRIRQIFANAAKNDLIRFIPASAPTRRLNLNVLVAEDNKVNQIVISGLLKQFSIHAMLVDNGKQALDLYQQDPDRFDLILMDCEMPEMDGYTAAKAIREIEQKMGLRKIPISALTAHILEEYRMKAEHAGMDEHLTKPINKQELERVLLRYTRSELRKVEKV